jgi:hypothetical protein
MALEVSRSPTERAKSEKNFSELLAIYRERLRASGGKQNDVARAAAFLVANSYGVYSGVGPLSEIQFNALRRQLDEAFASSPSFQRKRDRERQIEFELYGILGTAVLNPDESQRPRLKMLARESLIGLLGVSPDQLVITERGAEIRGRNSRN